MSEFGKAFDAGQARWDNWLPESEDPIRTCKRCKRQFNENDQDQDDHGKGWCDDCVEKPEDQ